MSDRTGKRDLLVLLLGFLLSVLVETTKDFLAARLEANWPLYYARIADHLPASISTWKAVILWIVGILIGYAWRWIATRRTFTRSEIPGPPNTSSPGTGATPVHQHTRLMKIDEPKSVEHPVGEMTVTGKYSDVPPPGWRFALLTRKDNTYWPHEKFRDNHDGTWRCPITESYPGEVQIIAAQVADGVYLWVNLYDYVGNKYDEWVGQRMETLPDSIRADDVINIKVVPKRGFGNLGGLRSLDPLIL